MAQEVGSWDLSVGDGVLRFGVDAGDQGRGVEHPRVHKRCWPKRAGDKLGEMLKVQSRRRVEERRMR